MSEVVTSEEFWNQHASQYTQKQKQPAQEIGTNFPYIVDQLSLHIIYIYLKVFPVHFWRI